MMPAPVFYDIVVHTSLIFHHAGLTLPHLTNEIPFLLLVKQNQVVSYKAK